MNLAQRRAESEKDWEPALVVPVPATPPKVYVLLRKLARPVTAQVRFEDALMYKLHRYGWSPSGWELFVAMPYSDRPDPCVAVINNDRDVQAVYAALPDR